MLSPVLESSVTPGWFRRRPTVSWPTEEVTSDIAREEGLRRERLIGQAAGTRRGSSGAPRPSIPGWP